jgi:hypothetical protein
MINKQSENRKFSLPPFFPKNRKGDIPITILVIGTIVICGFALFSFQLTNIKVRDSFVGLGVMEQLNSQIETNSSSELSLNDNITHTLLWWEIKTGSFSVEYLGKPE